MLAPSVFMKYVFADGTYEQPGGASSDGPWSSAAVCALAPDTSKPSEVAALSHCATLVIRPQLHIVSLNCVKYGGGGDGSGGDGGGGGEGGEGGGAGAPGTQMQ